mgnify:CR=1 FL=1
MTRRQMLLLAAWGVAAQVVQRVLGQTTAPATQDGGVVDVGSADDYPDDGSYDGHRASGVVLVRRSDRLHAFSSRCPHKGCKVRAMDDGGFRCPCHGSRFDQDGRVQNGPATSDLAPLKIKLSDASRILVRLPQP